MDETRIPLKAGTVLCTIDGRHFDLSQHQATGGSAITYTARAEGIALELCLKEYAPPGWVRQNGVFKNPTLDGMEMQQNSQTLLEQARQEMKISQQINSETLHVISHMEMLQVHSIRQPGESPVEAPAGELLPCAFLTMQNLNSAKGFFLGSLLAECERYSKSEAHPFGNRQQKRSYLSTPNVLTTLTIIRLLLEALQTIHKRFVHADISPGNMFIDGDLSTGKLRGVVLLDFGSAQTLKNGRVELLPQQKLYTTTAYCAPEIRQRYCSNGTPNLTPAVDIYAVGRLLKALLHQYGCFYLRHHDATNLERVLNETNGIQELRESDVNVSTRRVLRPLNELLCGALDPDPSRRITLNTMLEETEKLITRLAIPRYPLQENLCSADNFVPHSRDTELQNLEQKLTQQERPIWLWGFGGLGKTETAKAFLRRCKENGRQAALFSYEGSVRQSVLKLAFRDYEYRPSRSNMTPEQQEQEQYQQKLELLAEMGNDGVLVMDNFDSDTHTFDELRSEPEYCQLVELGGPHLIITTRFEPEGDPVRIDPLDEDTLLRLMHKEAPASCETTLRSIIRAVEGHTLTCYLIARNVRQSLGRLTAEAVLEALEWHNLQTLNGRVTSTRGNRLTKDTIYGHLKVVFDLTGMTGDLRAALCHALLLPQSGLDAAIFLLGETDSEQEAFQQLMDHGWIQYDPQTELLTIHPLVRELVLNELKPVEEDYEGYLSLLSQDGFFSTREENTIAMKKLELAQSVLALPMLSENEWLADILCSVAYHTFKRGKRKTSFAYYEKGIALYETLSQTDEKYKYPYASQLSALGFLMSATNDYQDASAQLLRKAVELWQQLNQKNGDRYLEEYAAACDRLGYRLSLSHDEVFHKDAEEVLYQAYEIRGQLYKQDPQKYARDFAWTLDNLGKVVTWAPEKFTEAEAFLREALEIRESLNRASNGANISEVAWTCHNLAQLLARKQEHWPEAETHYRTAIRLRRELDRLNPGTHTADISWTALKLAELLARQPDRRTETRHFFTEALRLQHQLQKEHPGMFVLDIAWFSQKYKHYLENLPKLAPEEQNDLQKLCNNASTPPPVL